MECCRWPTLIVALVTVLAAHSAHAEDRALLVGVGTYGQTTPFGNLNGIDRDLQTMREVARELDSKMDRFEFWPTRTRRTEESEVPLTAGSSTRLVRRASAVLF